MYQLADVIPLFLKFTNEDVADILVSGSFRLRNLKYYREYEDKQSKGIGDHYDGSAVLSNVIVRRTNTITGEIIETHVPRISSQDEGLLKLPVFCLFKVDNRMLKYSEVKGNMAVFKPFLEESEIEKIKEEFGNTVVLISAGTFEKSFRDYCSKNDIQFISDDIKYLDFNVNTKESFDLFLDPSNPKICFRKDICFSHQREYRFMLDKPQINDFKDIKLEGLDGAINKIPVEKFFSGELELRFPIIEQSQLR